MIAFLILIYASFYFLVFGKGLVKTNARNISIFVGVGVVLVGIIIFMWLTYAPTTKDGRTFQYVVQIVPNVAGPVTEVTADALVPLKKETYCSRSIRHSIRPLLTRSNHQSSEQRHRSCSLKYR